MEEDGGPYNDCGALVVEEFESKPILETDQLHDHAVQLERKIETDHEVSISGVNGSSDNTNNNVVLDECKKSSSSSSLEVEFRGSIAERRAAKFGFDASRINVAKFKVCSPPSSPPPFRSPYLTIPAGISPAALLDSPVMLPNSQVHPSPTTGTLPLLHCDHDSLVLNSDSPAADRNKNSALHSSALFKPPSDPTPIFPHPLTAENQPPKTSNSPPESKKEASVKSSALATSTETNILKNISQNPNYFHLQRHDTMITKNQMPQLRECVKGQKGTPESLQEDQKGIYAAATEMTRNAEDVYNWRKYGQKHVKGSEYPRSYYKCNNSSCPVKKKVERSHDGEITEIIYKGAHNHPKPHPRVSLGPPTPSSELLETSEGSEHCLKVKGVTAWRFRSESRSKDLKVSSDWRHYVLERTSSTSILTDIFDTTQGKSVTVLGSVDTPELASRVACQDGEDEDGATEGSTSQVDDVDGDESEPKRRKKEIFSTEAYLPSRSNREPRVIVQIESEIDVMDDGYRWRKYGQKVVKENPNPRSYYKCTSAGCPVRKHVERASDDIKSVLTTYEGKHNHEVPSTKTSGLPNASNSSSDVSDPNPVLTVSRNPNVCNRNMQVQDLPLHYDMKPALGNEFMRSSLLGDFVNDMQIGASSIYEMKFPPTAFQSSIPYGPFVMSCNGSDSQTSCQKFPPVVPDFPMSIPMNVPRSSTNMALNNNSFHSYNHNHATPNGTFQSSFGNQNIKEADLRFLRPKEEKKDDNLYDTSLATPDNANVTTSTVFCRAIGNFPT